MQSSLSKYSSMCMQISGWTFVLACLFSAFSTAALNVFTIAGVFFWLISGNVIQQLKVIRKNYVIQVLFVFFLLLLLSVFWSSASLEESLSGLKSYRKLLFFYAIFCICVFAPVWRKRIFYGMFTSCFLLAIASVCVALGIPGFPAPDAYQGAIVVKNHITEGFMLGVLVLLGLRMAIFDSRLGIKVLGLLGAILGIFVAFYLINGRTGFLSVGLAVGAIVLYLPNSFRQKAILVLGAVLLFGVVLSTSDRFQTRFEQATVEIEKYADSSNHNSSMGLRMFYLESGFKIIQKAPFLGHGVGSWKQEFDQLQFDRGITFDDPAYHVCTNPHNDFVMIAAQLGLIGLACWLLFLSLIYRSGFLLSKADRLVLQGLLLIYCGGALFNSFTSDATEGAVFLIMVASLLSRSYEQVTVYHRGNTPIIV